MTPSVIYPKTEAPHQSVVFLLHGQTGVGKSTVAGYLSSMFHAPLIRISDIHLLLDVNVLDWGIHFIEKHSSIKMIRNGVYRILVSHLDTLLSIDQPKFIFVDAAFVEETHRQTAYATCALHGVPCCLLHICCSEDSEIERRIQQRNPTSNDTTKEAYSMRVAEYIFSVSSPITENESAFLNAIIEFDSFTRHLVYRKRPKGILKTQTASIDAVFQILDAFSQN